MNMRGAVYQALLFPPTLTTDSALRIVESIRGKYGADVAGPATYAAQRDPPNV